MLNKQNRRAAVITIWGGPHSGKTVFSALLAGYLSQKKKSAIVISPDITVPMLPVFYPKENIEQSQSMGHIFESDHLDNSVVSKSVCVYKKHPNIGVIAYAPGDTPYTYTSYGYEKAISMIKTAASMTDFLILDCPNRVREIFTPAAIEAADISVCMLSPDLFGVSYYKANAGLLKDHRFHDCKELFFAGNCSPFEDVKGIADLTGRLDGSVPHNKRIQQAANEGNLFDAVKLCGKAHMETMKKIEEIAANISSRGDTNG